MVTDTRIRMHRRATALPSDRPIAVLNQLRCVLLGQPHHPRAPSNAPANQDHCPVREQPVRQGHPQKPLARAAPADPQLIQIIEQWASLPEAIRAAILAIVEGVRR